MSKVITSFQILQLKLMLRYDIHWFWAPIAPIISILKWLKVKVKSNMSSALDKI
jgi:hypothetical protein